MRTAPARFPARPPGDSGGSAVSTQPSSATGPQQPAAPSTRFWPLLPFFSSSECVLHFPDNLQGDEPSRSFTHSYKFCLILSKAEASHRSGSASFKSQLY